MQLTSKNLMVGDWVEYYIGEEGLEWEPTKIDWQDIKEVSENPEKFNDRHRPIPLTEDVLREIEGVVCDYKSNMHATYSIHDDILFDIWYDSGRQYARIGQRQIEVPYLHQLQQLCRCLGHELIINF